MIIYRILLGENKGTYADSKTLLEVLKELREIKKLKTKKVSNDKKEDLKKLKKEIEEMQIELAECTYKGMFNVKDILNLTEEELVDQVNFMITEE